MNTNSTQTSKSIFSEKYFCGIDLASKVIQVSVTKPGEGSFDKALSKDEFTKFIKANNPEDYIYGMEACGDSNYWAELMNTLCNDKAFIFPAKKCRSYNHGSALPTDFSARIARNTQIYVQNETQICREIDPWAGSYYVESMTNELVHKAWEHIQEIEKLGGMAKAIETGVPKMRIEEAAARTQARIDSGVQTIVGTNKYRLDHEDPMSILEVDNSAVRKQQEESLKELRANRDEKKVKETLAALTECVRTGEGNLLEKAVECAKVRCTLGEISDACEVVVGRYKAVIRTISGVYSSESKNDADFDKACELTEEFAKKEGRRPRVFIAKMGQDGHDRGAKVVATGYADCGFDVDMGPLFQTPAEAAREAVENDVHAVGVSSLAAGHKTLIPQLIAELKKLGREDIMVIAGGVIPAQDYDFLYKAGVAAIFGPGTSVAKAAVAMMEILLDK